MGSLQANSPEGRSLVARRRFQGVGTAVLAAALAAASGVTPCGAISTTAQNPSDWDLYSMRLINAARANPTSENQLRGTNYLLPTGAPYQPAPPLAYDAAIGRATINHVEWMINNVGNPLLTSTSSPKSYVHYQTGTGLATGAPLVGALSLGATFTGASVFDRVQYVGVNYAQSAGENLDLLASPDYPFIGSASVLADHVRWWNSASHRPRLLDLSSQGTPLGYTAFGHHTQRGVPYLWSGQDFVRTAQKAILGTVFQDKNNNDKWDPAEFSAPSHEGVGGVTVELFTQSGQLAVGAKTTWTNGGFSVYAPNGTYDVKFSLGSEVFWRQDVQLPGTLGGNVDLGDVNVALLAVDLAADFNGDGVVNGTDLATLRTSFGQTGASLSADATSDGAVDGADLLIWQRQMGTSPAFAVPEAAISPLLGLWLASRRQVRRTRSHRP